MKTVDWGFAGARSRDVGPPYSPASLADSEFAQTVRNIIRPGAIGANCESFRGLAAQAPNGRRNFEYSARRIAD
eukprot:15445559-Alexandrium_andersonii.AAC.1